MSINKVSPALKRYKPGEISKRMINNLDLESSGYDLKVNNINEEINYVVGSKSSMMNMTNSSVQKFEAPRNGPKNSLNNQVVTNTNNSKENCLVLNYKSQSIDEARLDASFEQLKNSIQNKNSFNKFILTRDFKEHLLPEKVFCTDSIIINSNSLVGENYTYLEKDKKIFVEKLKNLQVGINISEETQAKTFSDANHFENAITLTGLITRSYVGYKNSHHTQELYLNDTNQEYPAYRQIKIPMANVEDDKIQIKPIYQNLSVITNSCSLGNVIPDINETKENPPKLEFTLLSRKRKGPIDTNIEKPEKFDDQTINKEYKTRKSVFKTHRHPTEDGQNLKSDITTVHYNNKHINSICQNDNSSINFTIHNNTKQSDNPSINCKKSLPNSRQISYFDFKKFYNIHKVEASISENKEDFLISYIRSDGIDVRYHILYDQKSQKVLLIEKYFNNNLVDRISNDNTETDIISKIQLELCEMLKDISANVMKKSLA